MNARKQWGVEYEKRGIPSSFREDVSGSVRDFADFLMRQNINTGAGLDIGCGSGRNANFLASIGFDMQAMELVPELVDRINQQVSTSEGHGSVKAIVHDVGTPWPFPTHAFDIAIDTFCYKHQILQQAKDVYQGELVRTLKPGAFYLLTLAGTDDGYYGPLLSESPDSGRRVIVDPINQIASILYGKEDIQTEFGHGFDIVHYTHKKKPSRMHGQIFDRSTHLFIMRCRK